MLPSVLMNMGFAATGNAIVAPTQSYAAPFGMGLGDDLWLASIVICMVLARLA